LLNQREDQQKRDILRVNVSIKSDSKLVELNIVLALVSDLNKSTKTKFYQAQESTQYPQKS